MSDALEAGDLVDGRYVVEKLLGKGGMAEVYRVRHTHLDTQHALKVLTLGGRSLQTRLMQEGRVQAALRHPNIVAVSDVVLVESSMGLVMEYIQGPAMDELMAEMPLDLDQVDALVVPILDAVAAAHALDLIHRDLKPANVMLAIAGGQLIPKVADFGLVKLVAEDSEGFASKTSTGTAMGTPAYMAPEQIRDAKNVDARADVWSLGAILWEMVTGERCFDAPDILDLMVLVASGNRPPLREVRPDLPDRILNAIEGALVVDRDERIADVLTLRKIWLDGGSVPEAAWPAEAVERAKQLGSGGEETTDFLKRSFRSQEALPRQSSAVRKLGAGPTAVPREGDVETVAAVQTWAGEGADETASAETIAPSSAPSAPTLAPPESAVAQTVAEVDAPTAQAPGRDLGRIALVLMALVVLGGGATAVLGGTALWMGSAQVVPETVPKSPDPLPPPTGDPMPVPGPEPAPAPKTPEPEPAPTTAPEPAPTTAPAPGPAPAEPVAPAPEPVPEPVPEPSGTADPEPAPAAVASLGTLDNDGVTVSFLGPDGQPVPHDSLGPGRYTVVAFFEAREPTEVGQLALEAGDIVDIKCVRSQYKCKVSKR